MVQPTRALEGEDLKTSHRGDPRHWMSMPEEIDPATRAYWGNYLLALSQAGLVHAVLEVQKALNA